MLRSTTVRHRHARERGATLVEYALGVALVLVASIIAVQVLEDRGSDRLEASDERIGLPADGAVYPVGVTTISIPTTTTPETIPSTGIVVASATASPAPSQGSPNSKWVAKATLIIEDEDGNPVEGATISGLWNAAGSVNQNTAACDTDVNGQCQVQRNSIEDSQASVQFSISSVSRSGYSWTQAAGTVTVTVNCTATPGIC